MRISAIVLNKKKFDYNIDNIVLIVLYLGIIHYC